MDQCRLGETRKDVSVLDQADVATDRPGRPQLGLPRRGDAIATLETAAVPYQAAEAVAEFPDYTSHDSATRAARPRSLLPARAPYGSVRASTCRRRSSEAPAASFGTTIVRNHTPFASPAPSGYDGKRGKAPPRRSDGPGAVPSTKERRPMKVRCPRCQQKLNVPDKFAGKAIRCAACNRAFTVPKPKVAVAGPGLDAALDLEQLARLESQTTELGGEELAEAQAVQAARTTHQPGVRKCPNCGKTTPVEDMMIEVLCSHCWEPIPSASSTDAYDTGDIKLVGHKGTEKSDIGFYDGLSTSFGYPFQAVGSVLTAVAAAIAVILVPVALMTAVGQAVEQAAAGTVPGVQEADLTVVQILLRGVFLLQVLFFTAVGLHAFLDVIRATAIGNETPPQLNWNPSQWGKSVVATAALLAYYTVMTYIVLFLAEKGTPDIPTSIDAVAATLARPGVITGLVIVSSIVPMNLIGLSLGSVGQGLNPVNALRSILKTHVHYVFLVTLVCVFGAMALAAFVVILKEFLPVVDNMVTKSGEGKLFTVALGLLAWGLVIGFVFVATYVLGRMHGLFARTFRKKLMFGSQ